MPGEFLTTREPSYAPYYRPTRHCTFRSHPVGEKWSAEIGDAQYTYDWKKHRITLLPLSGQLNRILSFKHQDIHLYLRTQYNLKQESGSDKWTLTAGNWIPTDKRESR